MTGIYFGWVLPLSNFFFFRYLLYGDWWKRKKARGRGAYGAIELWWEFLFFSIWSLLFATWVLILLKIEVGVYCPCPTIPNLVFCFLYGTNPRQAISSLLSREKKEVSISFIYILLLHTILMSHSIITFIKVNFFKIVSTFQSMKFFLMITLYYHTKTLIFINVY